MGDNFEGPDLIAGSAAFSVMWGVGGIVGPSIDGRRSRCLRHRRVPDLGRRCLMRSCLSALRSPAAISSGSPPVFSQRFINLFAAIAAIVGLRLRARADVPAPVAAHGAGRHFAGNDRLQHRHGSRSASCSRASSCRGSSGGSGPKLVAIAAAWIARGDRRSPIHYTADHAWWFALRIAPWLRGLDPVLGQRGVDRAVCGGRLSHAHPGDLYQHPGA